MSDPGDIPRFGRVNLVEALSVARDLPIEALDLAAERPDRVAPAILAAVNRAADGAELSPGEQNLMFWGIHVLAEAADTRLCAPLLRCLGRSDDDLDLLLGPAATETLPKILISVYDGDLPALRSAIRNPSTPGIIRWSLFGVAAFLAATGRVARSDLHDLLVAYDAERPVGSSDEGWPGWEEAVALSGFADLSSRVAAARADGRLLEDLCRSPEEFESELAAAAAATDDLGRFAATGLGAFGRAVDELDAMLQLAEDGEEPPPIEPVVNPLRDLGRNDPCPCGSGRKYKKCCLAA